MDHPTTSPEPTAEDVYTAGAGLRPQEWWEVLAPPADIANATRALLPREAVLDVDELEALARSIAAREDLWQPLVVRDEARRRYRLMYEDEHIDIWVLAWMPGQGTGYHDHDLSGVGLCSAQGHVVEKQLMLPQGASVVEMTPGVSRQGPPGYIHSVAYGSGDPAVSIHCYSPPLVRVGQYRVDDHGILWRKTEHGRQELLDHTIEDVAPDLV